ncbi:MAG: site-specific integrase [Elusimicrobiota bacterium]|nr:site-specific integrase [Elusimicrobiota bacterium]
MRRAFMTALRKAGISNFRFHDLRHTFCSHLVMAGVDIYTVKELAGHRSVEMTIRYSHLAPNQKKVAVEILSSWMDTIWTPKTVDNSGAEILRQMSL